MHQLFILSLFCVIMIKQDVLVADTGTWYDVQRKNLALDGATELSFVTCYKQIQLHVTISSSVARKSRSYMPSTVSSDNSIQVCSSIYVHELADSVVGCISKETDAYTMLVDAVWNNMETYCGNTPVNDGVHYTSGV